MVWYGIDGIGTGIFFGYFHTLVLVLDPSEDLKCKDAKTCLATRKTSAARFYMQEMVPKKKWFLKFRKKISTFAAE